MEELIISLEREGVLHPVGRIVGNNSSDSCFAYSDNYLKSEDAAPVAVFIFSHPIRTHRSFVGTVFKTARDHCDQKSNRTFSPANRTFDRKTPPLYTESTKEALHMKQTIYEEMGGSYSMVGEYRLPDLAVNGDM